MKAAPTRRPYRLREMATAAISRTPPRGNNYLSPGGTRRPAPSLVAPRLERRRETGVLPQRIVLKQKTAFYVVYGSRIGPASLRKGQFFYAPSVQQSRKAEVSFDAARLVIKPVLLVALLGELFLHGPRPRPYGRIFDRDLVCKRGRASPCEALDQ